MVISDWCILDQSFAQCKGIQISESKKCLPVESGIPGLWNLEYSLRNSESYYRLGSRIQVPNDKEIRNPRRGVQNARLSWIPLRGAKSWRGPKELPYVAAGLVTRDLDQRDLYRGLIDCLRHRLGGTCYEMAYVLISIRKKKQATVQ